MQNGSFDQLEFLKSYSVVAFNGVSKEKSCSLEYDMSSEVSLFHLKNWNSEGCPLQG
jgi:hypothetical protein